MMTIASMTSPSNKHCFDDDEDPSSTPPNKDCFYTWYNCDEGGGGVIHHETIHELRQKKAGLFSK
jgi:hypothetical protein